MDKETMLKEIESRLKVVNKGMLNPDDFSDAHMEEIAEYHKMVTSRNEISPMEQSAILEELSKLRK
ncbi:DUF1128 family protein [Salinicoccus kekensis]|uniref:Uncharacterized protein YfkK (UPF0435 family) n=1 Tax=Salinicoccus kekensis TaxID=714307 RepID=A0A285UFE5_9STAP|nr:DUF1128 family protein [Salinicoccus kekensis]SOC40542.1 uncharacterized protein YfkK (UPF0435 family) [Salinicoccus kekensis]